MKLNVLSSPLSCFTPTYMFQLNELMTSTFQVLSFLFMKACQIFHQNILKIPTLLYYYSEASSYFTKIPYSTREIPLCS